MAVVSATGRDSGRFRGFREHGSAPADSCSARKMGVEVEL